MKYPDLTLLIVDDDPDICMLLGRQLSSELGLKIISVNDGQAALKKISETPVDIIITDLLMPKMGGKQLIQEVKKSGADITFIVISAITQIETAVETMRLGAYDYITKPFDPEIVTITIRKAAERHYLHKQNLMLQNLLLDQFIIGTSQGMQHVQKLIQQVAPTESNVLIRGNSGTGKELVARSLHRFSRRAEQKLVSVNCAALPESILESELFGHIKGAFTGATSNKKGLFEEADGATLFLDEIGDISLGMQAKLLRVLQNGEVKRIGDTSTIKVDTRIISATNQDLESKLKNKSFREDLYFRLNVISIHIPDLKDRREDIPLLAKHFLQIYAKKNNKPAMDLSDDAMEMLYEQSWPGNVRELQNSIERAVILAHGNTITPSDFNLGKHKQSVHEAETSVNSGIFSMNYKDAKRVSQESFNKSYLTAILARHGGNVTHAAKAAGLERQSFQKIMRACGIKSEGFRPKKK